MYLSYLLAVLKTKEFSHFLGLEDLSSLCYSGYSFGIQSSCVDLIEESIFKPCPLDLVRCSSFHMATEDDLTRMGPAF